MDHCPSVELLESVHQFPGSYRIKAIGEASDDFSGRVIAAVQAELAAASDLDYSERRTASGRHVAVTLEVTVQTPEQIRRLYEAIHAVKGLTLLF